VKILKAPINAVTDATSVAGVSMGKVMKRKRWNGPTPSIAAASQSADGIVWSSTRKMVKVIPTVCQRSTPTRLGRAQVPDAN
jgi:hypothetical protein